MANRRDSGGVVEDIWINTQIGLDDPDNPGRDDYAGYPHWNEIAETNVLVDPDLDSMEQK